LENTPKKETKAPETAFTMQKMVGLAVEFGFVIALPLVLFGLGGKWLDSHYHTNKVFTLVGILVALVFSVTLLARRINSIRMELNKKTGP
jgi:hypothetical protein